MNIPFELLSLFTVFTFGLTVIGLWKKIPFVMVISGTLMFFISVIVDTIDDNPIDMWFRIVLMTFSTIFVMGGALVWKSMED